jgi:hypothetical protein
MYNSSVGAIAMSVEAVGPSSTFSTPISTVYVVPLVTQPNFTYVYSAHSSL